MPAPCLGLYHEHCLSRALCKLPSSQALLPWSIHAPILQESYFLPSFSLNFQYLLPPTILTLKLLPTSQKKIPPSSYHHRALIAEAVLPGSPCSGSKQTAVQVTMGSQFLGEEGRLDGDRAVGMALPISVGSSIICEPATQQGVGIQCHFVYSFVLYFKLDMCRTKIN